MAVVLEKGQPVYTGEYLTDKVGVHGNSAAWRLRRNARKIAFELPDPAAIAAAALTI
jgi:hypothetical protein